jgi:hypothetical protein
MATMSKQEAGIEKVLDKALLIEAFGETKILEAINFRLTLNAPMDSEFEQEDLEGDLENVSIETVQEIFRSIPEHGKIKNLAGFAKGVHSYFYEFALALDSLADKIHKSGATSLSELKAHMFPESETKTEAEPRNQVVISAAEVVAQLIRNCVEEDTVRIDVVRNEVHGHEVLSHFHGGMKLADIVKQVVGKDIEIIIDDHSKALSAIKAYVNDGTEIPSDILEFIKSKIPGGTTIGGFTTDKMAHLYLTTQSDQKQYRTEIKVLSDRDHLNHGKSPDALVAKTEAEHLSDALSVLKSKREAEEMVLIHSDFSATFKNFLGKFYPKLSSLEERLRAFLRNQGQENLLAGFTFETRTAVDKLAEAEIKLGVKKIQEIVTGLKTEGVTEIGPSDIRIHEALVFLIGKTAREQGSNFSDRLRNFLKSQNKEDLLTGLKILNNEEDKVRVTNRQHLKTLVALIEAGTLQALSDIPEVVVGHLERHYRHKAPTTKARAQLFLKDQNRPELAEKMEASLKK